MYDNDDSNDSNDNFDESEGSEDIEEESTWLSDITAENSDLSSNYEYDCTQVSGATETIDETSIKNRMLKALIKVANVCTSDYAISGILSDAPVHAISIKVKNEKKNEFNCTDDCLFFCRKIRRSFASRCSKMTFHPSLMRSSNLRTVKGPKQSLMLHSEIHGIWIPMTLWYV